VAGFQTDSGGFLFGHKHGDPLPFVNPVSTAFCVQALVLWQDRQDNRGAGRLNAAEELI